jgi:hypothetical protein
MTTIIAGKLINYNGMSHRVLRVFDYKGDLKVELKNLHNNNQFIIFLSELE